MVISDLVDAMTRVGLIDVTITAGHAFGGDLEAVSVPSALALARHVAHADVAIVAMGPGVVGTSSPLGTTALEVAPILDAAAALGGRPVAVLRMSDGDGRERHRGVSHHSRTALDLVRTPVLVACPDAGAFEHARHDVRVVEGPDVPALLAELGLHVTTMGRGPDEDPLFFRATAAGRRAGRLDAPLGRVARGVGSEAGAPPQPDRTAARRRVGRSRPSRSSASSSTPRTWWRSDVRSSATRTSCDGWASRCGSSGCLACSPRSTATGSPERSTRSATPV